MPHQVRTAWIAPPVLAALTLPAMVSLVAGAPAAGAMPVMRPSWSAPVAMRACAGRAGVGQAAPGAADPAGDRTDDPAWTLQPALDANGMLEGWTLTTTAGGAATAELRLPPEAAVSGPVEGRLAVTADDGVESTIALVRPGESCAETVHRATEVVRQAILQPGTGAILFHAVRRSDRADLGIHAVEPGSGRPPTRVLAPIPAADAVLAEIGRVWSTRLLLAKGGSVLAVQSCGEASCRTRLVDLADGQARWLPGGSHGLLAGFDAATAVLFDACPGLPCPLRAADLAGGDRRLLSVGAQSAATSVVGGRLLALVVEEEHGARELLAIDPADGRRRRLGVDARDLALLPDLAGSAGIEPRDGWIKAIDERDGRPLRLDLASLLATSEESR